MAVPDFQTLMLPFLEISSDRAEHTYSELVERLSSQFGLSDDEKNELVPSGRQTKLLNRIYWIFTHFKHAKLVESVRRGAFIITDRGSDLVKSRPGRVDLKLLATYPEYNDFRKRKGRDNGKKNGSTILDDVVKTPDELLHDSYAAIRLTIASDLLEKIKQMSPAFFERLVVELLVRMGYGGNLEDAGQAVGKSGDGGIDGIIKEDRLGLDVIYLQAKRWENTVGSPEIQKFAGALQGRRAKKGVFITTADFSKGAREFASHIENKIILIDGTELAELMIDYNVGVSTERIYELKRIDSDYFIEE
ncbi:MAG: restriction endonuclease [Blastocatellia bacterium]